MPFRHLSDPVDVARCHAALESAWAAIKASGHVLLGTDESEKLRLAVIIANLAAVTSEEAELSARAIERFQTTRDR